MKKIILLCGIVFIPATAFAQPQELTIPKCKILDEYKFLGANLTGSSPRYTLDCNYSSNYSVQHSFSIDSRKICKFRAMDSSMKSCTSASNDVDDCVVTCS
jgi:hypothetical protein